MKKQYSLIDSLNAQLNSAYSINYTILENLTHLVPNNGQMVFTREDIFGKKTPEQQKYDNRFYTLASYRNDSFSAIKQSLSSLDFENMFKENTKTFVDFYQKDFKRPLQYNSLFSKDDIKNWDLFHRIGEEILNDTTTPNKDRAQFGSVYYEFMDFYYRYSNWKSIKEIFEVLDSDINTFGSKSIYYGNIDNPNVLKISIDDFNDFFDNVYGYLDIAETAINDRIKQLEKIKNDPDATEEFKQLCMILGQLRAIDDIYDKFGERFEAANRTIISNKQPLLNRILFGKKKEVEPENPFTINEFYVHKNELRELSELLKIFPDLDEEKNKLNELINPTSHSKEKTERE